MLILGTGGGEPEEAAWAPPDLAGLEFYSYATGRVIEDAGEVTEFSELGYPSITFASGFRPVLETVDGKLAVHFDGAADRGTGAKGSGINSPITKAVLVYFDNATQANSDIGLQIGYPTGADAMASIGRNVSGGNQDKYYTFDGAAALHGEVITGQTWLRIITQHLSSSPYHKAWVDGVAQTVVDNAAALTTNGTIAMGAYTTNGSLFLNYLDGAVGAQAVWSVEADAAGITNIDGWLASF